VSGPNAQLPPRRGAAAAEAGGSLTGSQRSAARATGTDTEWTAAAAAPRHRQALAALVEALVRAAGPEGLTADEAHVALPATHLPTVSRRMSQLAADGLVVDSGRRRSTRRACPAVVYVVAELAPAAEYAG
jgi:hypothetical protein